MSKETKIIMPDEIKDSEAIQEPVMKAQKPQQEEKKGNVIYFAVGIEGDETFNVQAENASAGNMLALITAVSTIELTLMCALDDGNNPKDVVMDSMKAFEVTRREAIITSLKARGYENAEEIFDLTRNPEGIIKK